MRLVTVIPCARLAPSVAASGQSIAANAANPAGSRSGLARVLLGSFWAAMLLAALVGLSSAARAGPTPPAYVARHGLSPADYQTAFDTYGKQGFRLVSVSGYVVGGQLQYAALWRQAAGPAWAARHGLSAADLDKAITDFGKQGMRLTYIDGYEVNGAPQFAGIWEASSAPAPTVKIGMTGADYQAAFDALGKQGFRLLFVAGYTQGGSARYAAIWDKSAGPAYIAHNGMSPADYQATFNDLASQGFRLREVSGYSPGGSDQYAAIWDKGGDGAPWIAHNGVAVADYQTSFDVDRYQGYQPLYVQAFTSGSTARFDTIWESAFSAADLATIFNTMNGALKSTPVAGLSIAVGQNGRLVFASGFGFADKEAGVAMNINHRLRIGSATKTTTSVAIFRLIQAGAKFNGNQTLTLESPVFGPGGILSDVAIPPLLAPLKTAQVHNFLEHTSGIPSNAGDPTHCASGSLDNRIGYQLAQIAAIPATSTSPVGPVPRAPGTKFDYSNLNFQILQAVIERISGKSYQDYLLENVWGPIGVTAPRLFHIGPYDPSIGEAKQYLVNGGYAEYYPQGTCDNLPPGVGAGGWSVSARDMLRFLSSVNGAYPGQIVTADSRTAMLHRPLDDDPTNTALDYRYARGWLTRSWGACDTAWNIVQGHNGGLSGGYSDVFYLQENGLSFVMIANQDAPVAGMCRPSAATTVPPPPPPAPVPCGGNNQPPCSDEAVARVIDMVRKVNWPGYDLF